MRAVIYTRISTEHQEDGHSVDEQIRRCKQQIERIRESIPETEFVRHYHDTGSGSGFEKRKQYREMMENAGKEWNLVVFMKLDRVHRNMKNQVMWSDELREKNCNFVSYSEPFFDTTSANGELVFNIFGAFADYERKLIAERVKIGMEGALQAGHWRGSPPLGYAIDTTFASDGTRKSVGKLIPNEEEIPAVLEILTSHALGLKTSKIINNLVDKGIRTRQGNVIWNPTTIKACIDRRLLYIAGVNIKKEAAEQCHIFTPITESISFLEVQAGEKHESKWDFALLARGIVFWDPKEHAFVPDEGTEKHWSPLESAEHLNGSCIVRILIQTGDDDDE